MSDRQDKVNAWASYAQNSASPHILHADVARRIADALLANAEAETAKLLARIQQLEERAAQAAQLVSKAVEMMAPPKV